MIHGIVIGIIIGLGVGAIGVSYADDTPHEAEAYIASYVMAIAYGDGTDGKTHNMRMDENGYVLARCIEPKP